MRVLGNAITAIGALVGVLIGSFLASRNQRLQIREANRITVIQDMQNACVNYMAACRKARRYAMYSDMQVEEVPPTETSKGTFIIENFPEYDTQLSDALARMHIIITHEPIITAANKLSRDCGELMWARVRYGTGRIPSEIIRTCKDSEYGFAEVVRQHFSPKLMA